MVLYEAFVYNQQAANPSDMYMDKIYVINWLIEHNNYSRYLEIGTRFNDCFSKVKCAHKTGVDPVSGGTHRMTSDQFFDRCVKSDDEKNNIGKFDLIFIDGLHHHVQIDRDIENALNVLNDGGIILMHDCHPLCEKSSRYPYDTSTGTQNGDGFKSIWRLLVERDDLDVRVLGIDWGLGIIQKKARTLDIKSIPLLNMGLRHFDLYSQYTYSVLPRIKQQWADIMQWLPSNSKSRHITDQVISHIIVPYAKKVIPV